MKWNECLEKEWQDLALFMDMKIYSWGQGEDKTGGGKSQHDKELTYS